MKHSQNLFKYGTLPPPPNPLFASGRTSAPWNIHWETGIRSFQLPLVERDCIRDRSCSPVKFVPDLKITVDLSARMLLGTHRASFISPRSWQSPRFPLGKSPLRAHTRPERTSLFLLLFVQHQDLQELSSPFQGSRCLETPFTIKPFKAFSVEALSLQGAVRTSTVLAVLLALRSHSLCFHVAAYCLPCWASGFGVRLGFYHWPGIDRGQTTSLCLGFVICKIEIILPTA